MRRELPRAELCRLCRLLRSRLLERRAARIHRMADRLSVGVWVAVEDLSDDQRGRDLASTLIVITGVTFGARPPAFDPPFATRPRARARPSPPRRCGPCAPSRRFGHVGPAPRS